MSAGCDAKVSKAKKVLESLHDQENAVCSDPPLPAKSANPLASNKRTEKAPLSSRSTVNNGTTVVNNKRKSPDIVASQSKRAKKTAGPKVAAKKKTMPLQKGQKQLTAFFRV